MRIRGWAGVVALLMIAQGAQAQGPGTTLTIEGTSTVRGWTCEATGFTMAPRPVTGFEPGVLREEKTLEAVTVTFAVAAIECGNGTMNEHLRKALRAEDHPDITYTMATYDFAGAEDGVMVRAEGRLTIAGQARPIVMDVTVATEGGGGLRVKGEQVIDMTDFGVKPPRLMLGTLRVGDEVRVAFDLPLRLHPAAVAAADGGTDN